MFNKKRCFTRRRDVVLLCFVVVLLVAVVVTFGICFYDSHLKYVWPFLYVSLCLSRLQHCGVLTNVDWTGLSVSKHPVVPAPYYLSLSVSYCPNSNYETVVATSCLPCNAYAYASATASTPPPHHMRMPQSNSQQHKRSFSLHLPLF